MTVGPPAPDRVTLPLIADKHAREEPIVMVTAHRGLSPGRRASGVGVSVVLRQAHGFEGRLPVTGVRPPVHDLPVLDLEHAPVIDAVVDPANHSLHAANKHYRIASVDPPVWAPPRFRQRASARPSVWRSPRSPATSPAQYPAGRSTASGSDLLGAFSGRLSDRAEKRPTARTRPPPQTTCCRRSWPGRHRDRRRRPSPGRAPRSR